MKRILIAIPAILLILLNACGDPAVPAVTETPTGTPTPTSPPLPTVDIVSPTIFSYLNRALEGLEDQTKFDRLEHITGASYQVVHVEFPRNETDGSFVFRVDTRCECALNARCCSPTRTFVVTLMAVGIYQTEIMGQVQSAGLVSIMEVWIYDHADLTDVVVVPWADVQSFLTGNIDGYQLAARVGQTPFP